MVRKRSFVKPRSIILLAATVLSGSLAQASAQDQAASASPGSDQEMLRETLIDRLSRVRALEARLVAALTELGYDEAAEPAPGDRAELADAEPQASDAGAADFAAEAESMRAAPAQNRSGPAGQRPRPHRPPPGRFQQRLQQAREVAPEIAERLEGMQRRRPAFAEELMSKAGHRLDAMQQRRDLDERGTQLRQQMLDLDLQIAERGELLAPEDRLTDEEMVRLATSRFELQSELLEHEIGKLEERIARMRAMSSKRAANKDRLIERALSGRPGERSRGQRPGPSADD